jgi:hypothetical protein
MAKSKVAMANEEPIVIATDMLNVLPDPVKPLPEHVLRKLAEGKKTKTQFLDGSMLEQHDHLKPYSLTHVTMTFVNEEDIVRCARMLQWSDERMRARTDPIILWKWKEAYRDNMTVEFAVAWYTEAFFNERKDAFLDTQHASYYSTFGLKPADIKIRHEICQ